MNFPPRRDIKHIVRDLKKLEKCSYYQFMLVVVLPDSSKAHIAASDAIEAGLGSVFPADCSDRLLRLVNDYNAAANVPSDADQSPLLLDDTFPDCRELSIQPSRPPHSPRADTNRDRPAHISTSSPDRRHAAKADAASYSLSPASSACSAAKPSPAASHDSTPRVYTPPKWTLSPSEPAPDDFLSQAQRDRPPPLHIGANDEIPPVRSSPDGHHTEYYPLVINDKEAVTVFLEAKFRQLQQLACKVVAKAWIKVIEPKKQSNHPYNKGDEFKPDWWPSQARHKEPDHLMKPERLILLISMLRCRRVELHQLRAATTECAISIPPEKMEVLEEIYYVAEMEERAARAKADDPASDKVAVVWTISPEKPVKSLQAAAASAAVLASSRSLLSTRMPDVAGTSPKRGSSAVDDDPGELKPAAMVLQSQQDHARKKARVSSPVLAPQQVAPAQMALSNQVGPQYMRFVPSMTPMEYTPRDGHVMEELQYAYPQLHRRYTTGTVVLLPDAEHSPVYSAYSVPRRNSHHVDSQPPAMYAGTVGLPESSYDAAEGFEYPNLASKAYTSATPRLNHNGLLIDAEGMHYNPDMQNMADFAVNYGTAQASSMRH